MMNRKGTIWIILGLLLIAAALLITAHNLRENSYVGEVSEEVVNQLDEIIPSQPVQEPTKEHDSAGSPEYPMEAFTEEEIPDYILNPNMEMPTETINGNEYIGVLEIPSLELRLPVMSEWSYPKLKIAPCRYEGSAYTNALIIAAHNYASHFGQLKNLHIGDEIIFTDMDGNVFRYELVELETLMPTAIEEMTSGDWDLTLFTCTIGGRSRVTVRCELAEEST